MYQKFNLFLFKLFIFALIVLVMQSCGPGKPGVWKNEQINPDKRADLHAINAEVLKDLQDNRYKALQFLLSKDLLDDSEMMRTVEKASIYIKQDTFSLLREYYAVSKPDTKITIGERTSGVNNFDLHYQTPTSEMYVAFFVQQNLADKHIISAVYNKFDYGWKLSRLEIDQYTVAGKTAPELYTQAKAQLNKGYLIDAVNNMTLATQCMQPCTGWDYSSEDEMANFHSTLISAANQKYRFPFNISQVASHPQIIRVFNQKTPEGLFPMIYYLSKIKLADTAAIKKENQQIKQVIGNLMPGIDKDKKYVLYAAFNSKPSVKASVDHFDMTDKLR